MRVVQEVTVDRALMKALELLRSDHVSLPSRNGPVWKFTTPVTTVWAPGADIVSGWDVRNANPFFHLMEALWMLAGRQDLAFVSKYASNMVQYSDDGGVTQPGAYGFRWRNRFDADQLEGVITELAKDPTSRRVVLSMWDPYGDPGAAAAGSKDVPCNTHAYFDLSGGTLDMTVCCRSNDIVWGAYGSNVVHFSLLQEYVAVALKVRSGRYYQMSNNLHAYVERPDVANIMERAEDMRFFFPILEGVHREPLFSEPWQREYFDVELRENLDGLTGNSGIVFLDHVARPMQQAWALHKQGDTLAAIALLGAVPVDWMCAGRSWLARAHERKVLKSGDQV